MLPTATADLFKSRSEFALEKLADLQARVAEKAKGVDLDGLTIFTVGSYGRLEASTHSDIDLFFVYERESLKETRRTNELKLFGRLIDVVEDMNFPSLSNDAQYLQSHFMEDMLEHLGSPQDDGRNYFTTRLLLLLESRCVFGSESYDKVLTDLISPYYRDYPGHENAFRPWFLLNDIMRFWKTILLNYENKRNRPSENTADPRPRVKNFKLQFSRATTCFATICALGSMPGPVSAGDVKSLVTITPRERLSRVSDNLPGTSGRVEDILEDYAWFLERTGLATDELESLFVDKESKQAMFDRARNYCDKLFGLVREIDKHSNDELIRALVL